MKRRHLLLGAALVVAAWLALIADKTPESRLVEPVLRAHRATGRGAARVVPETAVMVPDAIDVLTLVPRQQLIGGAHSAGVAGLFGSQNWEPPAAPVVLVKPQPPAPPVAPLLPYSFLGKQLEDGVWQVFLGRGEQTFIVREQSIIEGLYRVDAIRPPQLSLTYLPLKQAQTLTIGSTD